MYAILFKDCIINVVDFSIANYRFTKYRVKYCLCRFTTHLPHIV